MPRITSPDLIPAALPANPAGLPRREPFVGLEAKAIGDFRCHRLNLNTNPAPCHAALSFSAAMNFARCRGNGEPMPTLPPDGEKIAVLTPTTWPWLLKLGPPELPRFTGASIAGSRRKARANIAPRAEMMPAVTVPPKPKGLPTAITIRRRAAWISRIPQIGKCRLA